MTPTTSGSNAAQGCAVCGRTLSGARFRNGWGEEWCAAHERVSSCTWCRRVGGTKLVRGQLRCDRCRDEGVEPGSRLDRLRREVLGAFTGWFGTHQLDHVPVEATGGTLVIAGGRRVGRTHSTSARRPGDLRITISPGMPVDLAGAVLAHEYGHVVMRFTLDALELRPSAALSKPEVEGFCEVVAAEWLSGRSSQAGRLHRQAMDRNPDPVYGDGFRAMLVRRERAGSLPALLAELVASPATGRSRVKRSASSTGARQTGRS